MERFELPHRGCQRPIVAAQALFGAMQRRDVPGDRNLPYQFAVGVQQWRGLEGDSDDFAVLFAPLGETRRHKPGAYPLQNARVIHIGEVGGMQLAQRLTHGFVRGKPIQGGCFAVPICDDRIQILNDDGLAGLLEHLRENLIKAMRSRLRMPVRGTANYLWLQDLHLAPQREKNSDDSPTVPKAMRRRKPTSVATAHI